MPTRKGTTAFGAMVVVEVTADQAGSSAGLRRSWTKDVVCLYRVFGDYSLRCESHCRSIRISREHLFYDVPLSHDMAVVRCQLAGTL